VVLSKKPLTGADAFIDGPVPIRIEALRYGGPRADITGSLRVWSRLEGDRTQSEVRARRLHRDLLVPGLVLPFFKPHFVVRSVS
jgi:hypothetical protein